MYNYRINYEFQNIDLDKEGTGWIDIELENKLYKDSKDQIKINTTNKIVFQLEDAIQQKHWHDMVRITDYKLRG